MGRERMMYMYKVDLQVFPSKKLLFFPPSLFALFLLHTLHCFHWLRSRWCCNAGKPAGVIFTGGQGTWVIKLASIFHSLKKNLPPRPSPPSPPFTFPVKAQDLCGKSVSYGGVCGRAKMCLFFRRAARSPPHTASKHTDCWLLTLCHGRSVFRWF